ncbi:MAG: hypothetical protein ACLFS3_03275 [Candidatus Aenigmatarchaeota archaeon]
MLKKDKGQIEVVSAILLTGIMISLVSVAYFWGLPMIEKQKDRTKLRQTENFLKDLNDAVKEVARNGGRRQVNGEIPGSLKFESATPPDHDNITIKFKTTGSLMATGKTVYLVGNSNMEAPVTSEAGIVTAYSEQIEDMYEIEMKLFYRNLTTIKGKNEVYRIDLHNQGRGSFENQRVTASLEAGRSGYNESLGMYVNNINLRFQ